MSNLLGMLTQQLSGNVTRQLSDRLGADENATGSAMNAALPLLLGALAKNDGTPDGARSLHAALERDHDGGVLDDLTGAVQQPRTDADGILKHLLGDRRAQAEAAISRTSGVNLSQASTMLSTLAPMVMGMLGRSQRTQKLDATALAGMLSSERKGLQGNPAESLLTGLLDRDGDGQVMDDVASFARNFFSR